jgi:hypothetical protein
VQTPYPQTARVATAKTWRVTRSDASIEEEEREEGEGDEERKLGLGGTAISGSSPSLWRVACLVMRRSCSGAAAGVTVRYGWSSGRLDGVLGLVWFGLV